MSRMGAFGLIWLLFNAPVNNFSVMLGRSHCFLDIYQDGCNNKVNENVRASIEDRNYPSIK